MHERPFPVRSLCGQLVPAEQAPELTQRATARLEVADLLARDQQAPSGTGQLAKSFGSLAGGEAPSVQERRVAVASAALVSICSPSRSRRGRAPSAISPGARNRKGRHAVRAIMVLSGLRSGEAPCPPGAASDRREAASQAPLRGRQTVL